MQFSRFQILLTFFLLFLGTGNLFAGTNSDVLFREYLAMSNDYKARVGNSYLLKYYSSHAVLIYSDDPIVKQIKDKHPEVFGSIDFSEFQNADYPFIAVKANQLVDIKQHSEDIGNYNACLSILGTNKKGKKLVLALQYVNEDFGWKILKAFTGFAPETFKGYLKAPCSAFNQR